MNGPSHVILTSTTVFKKPGITVRHADGSVGFIEVSPKQIRDFLVSKSGESVVIAKLEAGATVIGESISTGVLMEFGALSRAVDDQGEPLFVGHISHG